MKNITLILFFTSLSIVGFCQNDTSYAIIDSIPAGSELKGESEYETPKEIDIKAFNYREKIKLDKYSAYVIEDGKEVFNQLLGTKCEIFFKEDLYLISFQTESNETGYQKLKVVSRKDNEIKVKVLMDRRPKPAIYLVKDSLDTKQKIEFISIDTGNVSHGMKVSN